MMGSNDSLQNNNNNNNNGAGNTITITNTNPFPGGSRGPTRSTVSGQSVSTSGSAGSPSTRSDSTVLRLNRLHIHADDDAASQLASGKKKKRAQRAIGGDKGGRGLRQFSMKVCEKVESKGRTTYNEVADELVAEFSDPGDGDQAPDQKQYDEKNIRRRVYDAINVLMALDIISKDKKEIQWRGLAGTSQNDIEELKSERIALKNRIEKKTAYLGELEDQRVGVQNLIKRNEQLYSSGNTPSGGVALPFILIQTRPHATVEMEISEDMQLVHFDFNSTPFRLHDDNYVLKAMNLGNGPNTVCTEGGAGSKMFQPRVPLPPRPTAPHGRPPPSPPLPGSVKYEH